MAIINYKLSFRLNNGNKLKNEKTKALIYFRYRQGRVFSFSISTGLRVLFNDWDAQKQRLRQKAHIKNKEQINSFLTDLVAYFETELLQLTKQRIIPTKEDIRKLYNDFLNPPVKETKQTLFSFIDTFIEKAKTQPNQTTKRLVSNITIRGYGSTKNILKDFSNEVYKLDFDKITIGFYYDFIQFCNDRNLSYNYIGKHIKTIKTFMLSALNNDLHDTKDFQLKEFAKLKEDTDAIYLNESELTQMYDLDLSKTPTLDKAKDLFLLGAYTGLRFSDWQKVNTRNIQTINNIQMLVIETQKTSKKVSIPLHSIVKNILAKYKGTPPTAHAHKINEQIKEVGKLAKIEVLTTQKSPTKNNLKTLINKPKYELIMTHTARRSFCTNAYLLGMPTNDIMAISGHETETSFLKYIKISSEQRASKMAKHKFFNTNVNLKLVK